MQLRHKFSLVALAYLLALAANLVLACWCILVYFNSAFGEFEEALAGQGVIDEIRSNVRQQGKVLSEPALASERQQDYEECQQQIEAGCQRLWEDGGLPAPLRGDIEAAAARKNAAAAACLAGAATQVLSDADREAFLQLDRALGQASHFYRRQREEHLRRAAFVEQRVVMILTASTLIGALLCVAGLSGMHRWVVRPVSDLRTATREIAQGHFDHRVIPRSADELGQLAVEVNQMCATIVEMQRRLVDRERLAAAGETITRVAHNIRNPLSGMRALAEAATERVRGDAETLDYLRRIIESIDRFERWLRDLQQSLAPLTLKTGEVDTREMISGVAQVVSGMLHRRNVALEIDVHPRAGRVRVDPLHFEQALVALVTNAVQASGPGQHVRIRAEPVGGDSREWRLTVADSGPGIAPELLDRIFSPYFTTKPDGSGMGLAIAQKVVRLHGGELCVESNARQGSRFIAVLPGLLD